MLDTTALKSGTGCNAYSDCLTCGFEKCLLEIKTKPTVTKPHMAITDRQISILRYIAQGYNNREIGEKLGITEQTIKNHLSEIRFRLRTHNTISSVVKAIKMGIININEL